ncbi:MAG TPA: PH domain-containing protein [Candidatus Paceibacterota bacterium]
MITLYPNEKILMVVHKHWIAFFSKIIIVAILLMAPAVFLGFISNANGINSETIIYIKFFAINYLMIIILVAFLFWMDHYLDLWIITTERVIDVEQHGLFRRETSEFSVDKVQDITVEVPHMLATFLKYGNLRIQTAGERSFTIKDVPNIYEIKKTIMDQITKRDYVGP